jgi:hypothetical protein
MSQENILIKYGKSSRMPAIIISSRKSRDEHSVEEIESFDKKKSYLENT